jgi:biotin carboxyl carrier protein
MPIYEVHIDDKPRYVELLRTGENRFTCRIDGRVLVVELQAGSDLGSEFQIVVNGDVHEIELPELPSQGEHPVLVDGTTFKAKVRAASRRRLSAAFDPSIVTPKEAAPTVRQVGEGSVAAPMTGKIISVMVEKGDRVEAGQALCILEAMKMENEIMAYRAGTVKELYISVGASVNEGDVLMVIE